jgi:hypothetical protein
MMRNTSPSRRIDDRSVNARDVIGLLCLAAGALLSCADAGRESSRADTSRVPEDSVVSRGTDSVPSPGAARLRSAAEEIVSFLAGDADFEAVELADTVVLYVAPEGGGATARISRARLRDRNAWRVGSGSTQHSFVPTGLLTKMTTRVGKHMNCREADLATRVPNLASRPHVGVRLEPPEMKSCLETWNATFVFDTAGGPPRLIAAVYDQWEW